MKLVPISKRAAPQGSLSPIFKSADPYFNHEAAQAAYDLVMKMDDDEAEAFVTTVVADVVEETIEKNLRTVQRHLDNVVAKRIEMAKRATIRTALSKRDTGAVQYADTLAKIEEITKAGNKNPYDYGYVWNENDFRRDPSTGRFQAKITHTQKKPIREDIASSMGIKPPKQKIANKQVQAQYQDEYRQLANFLSNTMQSGESEVMLQVEDKKSGQRHFVQHTKTTRPDRDAWDPTTERLTGVMAKPTTLTMGGAAFSVQSALGNYNPRVARTANVVDANMNDFAATWTQEQTPGNSNARTYARIERGSKIIGQAAPPGSKVQLASRFGEFVGSHGPEAEAVIGPTARKTAYRYRGTEKRPSSELVEAYRQGVERGRNEERNDPEVARKYRAAVNRAVTNRKTQIATERNAKGERLDRNAITLPKEEMKAIEAAQSKRFFGDAKEPTWQQRNAGRGEVVEYLRGKLPSADLYELQLQSGNTPPSQGVMMNAKGQIVAEAVGYADDHYLPFNLGNLKNLKGGEYIRTRSAGGPTAEDIYTGLSSGARQVQVVSRSGTFTVTFQDDFRGGRRHNDKARRMTRKYEQILDTVQSETVDRQKLKPEFRRAFQDRVRREWGHESPEVQRQALNRLIEDYKNNPELTAQQEEVVEQLAEARASANNSPDSRAFADQIRNEMMMDKQVHYRLDGQGYEAALKALEEQFPYYITVHSEVRNPKELVDTERDKGYVAPRDIRPYQAKVGLHGRGKGGKKTSAADANYAGANAITRKKTQTQSAASDDDTADTADATDKPKEGKTPKPKDEVRAAIERSKIADKGREVRDAYLADFGAGLTDLEKEYYPTLTAADDETLNRMLSTPEGMKQLDLEIEAIRRDKGWKDLPEGIKNAIQQYGKVAGNYGRVEYDPKFALSTREDRFYNFSGALGYNAGDSSADKQRAVKKIDEHSSSIRDGRKLSDLTDSELRSEVHAVEEVLRVADQNPDLFEQNLEGAEKREEARREILEERGFKGGKEMMTDRKKLERHAENVHRMRTLKHDFPEEVEAARQPQPSPKKILADEKSNKQISRPEHLKAKQHEIANIALRAGQAKIDPRVVADPEVRELAERVRVDAEIMMNDLDRGIYDPGQNASLVEQMFQLEEYLKGTE